MIELELTRTSGDRHLYELQGSGTLRLERSFSASAAAEAGDRSWQIARRPERWRVARRGELILVIEATDPSGVVAGEFHGRAQVPGGTLRWGERHLELRKNSRWRPRFALVDGERELATVEGKGWGKRPVRLTIGDAASVEPGMLLLAAFAVGAITEDAQRNSAAAVRAGSA